MREIRNIVAFDCGNSSIRVILGRFDGEHIEPTLVHQVEQKEIEINGLFYWDILYIFSELQKGLQAAYRECGRIDSAGICTWGIDFGMIGGQGQLISNPLCYRNSLGGRVLQRLSPDERRQMFDLTGIHNHQMNSLYQLKAYQEEFPEQLAAVKGILLIPDLLAYLFTGVRAGERTIASTTQYYSVIDKDYSKAVLEKFSLEPTLFPPLIENGAVIGEIKPEIANSLKINTFPFICVPSHDTACAAAAAPAAEGDFAFISSGTWNLIGTELAKPIVNDDVYASGLANEGGVFNTITLLKNSAGMFIIQRIRSEMAASGKKLSWDEIVAMAVSAGDDTLLFDPNDGSLYNPASMTEAIRMLFTKTGQNASCSLEEVIRSVYESLAQSYKYVLDGIEKITGKTYESIHIIGGGSKNGFLNQLAADATGKRVYAGPSEATGLGNIGVQIASAFTGRDKLKEIRRIIRQSVHTEEYLPCTVNHADKYKRYLELMGK